MFLCSKIKSRTGRKRETQSKRKRKLPESYCYPARSADVRCMWFLLIFVSVYVYLTAKQKPKKYEKISCLFFFFGVKVNALQARISVLSLNSSQSVFQLHGTRTNAKKGMYVCIFTLEYKFSLKIVISQIQDGSIIFHIYIFVNVYIPCVILLF